MRKYTRKYPNPKPVRKPCTNPTPNPNPVTLSPGDIYKTLARVSSQKLSLYSVFG